MKKITLLTTAIALSCAVNVAHGALYYRGNGMVYDSTLNVTWLQDANYAATIDLQALYPNWVAPDGGMNFSRARSWVGGLSYGGYDDWRLPKDLAGNDSEMLSLYRQLGNISSYDTNSTTYSSWVNTSFTDATTGNTVSFINVPHTPSLGNEESDWVRYWLQDGPVEYWGNMGPATTSFLGLMGREWFDPTYESNLVWAVRDGDVSQVPVPAAGWLLGSGLAGLIVARRHRKR